MVVIDKYFILGPALETKIYYRIYKVLISLPCGILVHYAQKSHVETDLAPFQLPPLFKKSITGLL